MEFFILVQNLLFSHFILYNNNIKAAWKIAMNKIVVKKLMLFTIELSDSTLIVFNFWFDWALSNFWIKRVLSTFKNPNFSIIKSMPAITSETFLGMYALVINNKNKIWSWFTTDHRLERVVLFYSWSNVYKNKYSGY